MSVETVDSIDANPSETLTTQIASSILQERYGVRGANAAPPRVQEAVRRCLEDVSKTVRSEHPQWDLPKYHGQHFRSSLSVSRSSSRDSEYGRRRVGVLPEEEDDPFLYDKNDNERASMIRAKEQDDSSRALEGRAGTDSQGYPCPFRRRDPISFNVRDYESCSRRPFADILELKYASVPVSHIVQVNHG